VNRHGGYLTGRSGLGGRGDRTHDPQGDRDRERADGHQTLIGSSPWQLERRSGRFEPLKVSVVPTPRETLERARSEPALLVVGAVFLAGLALRLWFMAAWPAGSVGFYDAGSYVATSQELAGSPVRPLGYPIFLRALHGLSAQLAWTIAVQHLLGLATAALLYLTTRRITRSRLAALVPAAVVLFDGLLVMLEHTLLSETLFIFLVATSTYAAVRSLDDGPPWAALSGAAAAARRSRGPSDSS
jgi:Dolichyl-phosphate-mannose-protein mannosyltransferase